MTDSHAEFRQQIVAAAQRFLDTGVLSYSLHGNISVRVPDTDEIVMTGSSLSDLKEAGLVVLRLDGSLVSGTMASQAREIIRMHTGVYQERDDIGCVVHTHSPHATAFAVAGKPLPCVAEALARMGVEQDIPVAGYAPRGSEESVSNLLQHFRDPRNEAVLLENHGILAAGPDTDTAVRLTIAMEEAAQLAIYAASLGGAKKLSPQLARAASARQKQFATEGTVHGDKSGG